MASLNIKGVLCTSLKSRPYATMGQFNAQRTKRLNTARRAYNYLLSRGEQAKGHLYDETDFKPDILVSLEEVTALSIDEFCKLRLEGKIDKNKIVF